MFFQAIALTFDKETVRRYLCSGISVQLGQFCRTGLMDTLLSCTIPDRVAKQVCWHDANVFIINIKRVTQSEASTFVVLTAFLSAFFLCFLLVNSVPQGHLPFLFLNVLRS